MRLRISALKDFISQFSHRFLTASLLLGAVLASSAQSVAQGAVPASKVSVAANYGKLPLSFEANQGQTDSQVRFLSRGNGYSLFLTDSSAVLALRKPEHLKAKPDGSSVGLAGTSGRQTPESFKTDVVRMD